MSNDLQDLVEEARLAMLRSPFHDLPLGYRNAIAATLAPDSGGQHRIRQGHRCATILEILSIRYVLPIWERARPGDDTPHCLLNMAEQVLRGTLDPETIGAEIGDFIAYMDNLDFDDEDQTVICVGRGAVAALSLAISYTDVPPRNFDYELTDADVDPYENDAAFYAAAAYADGPTWTPTSDATRRKEFWEWWLLKAIPIAQEARL